MAWAVPAQQLASAVRLVPIAVLGGTVGACVAWFLAGQIGVSGTTVGLALTAVGWFVNARLSERGQVRLLRMTILNQARIDLLEQIRREQDWIRAVNGLSFRFRLALDAEQHMSDTEAERQFAWLRRFDEARQILFRPLQPFRNFTMVMEEYEGLFPETVRARHQLRVAVMLRFEAYQRHLSALLEPSTRAGAVTAMERELSANQDYQALLHDLLVHVQNAALGSMIGHQIEERRPQDASVPILGRGKDGLLDVTERGVSWPEYTDAEARFHRAEGEGDRP